MRSAIGRLSGGPGPAAAAVAFPQIRFVSLLENGTHVLFASRMGPCARGEITLAKQVLPALKKGMLCLADRNFLGYQLWPQPAPAGRSCCAGEKNLRLPIERRLADGSYLSRLYPAEPDRRKRARGVAVRVIEYDLGAEHSEPFYRLLTTILDPEQAPASELGRALSRAWGDRSGAG